MQVSKGANYRSPPCPPIAHLFLEQLQRVLCEVHKVDVHEERLRLPVAEDDGHCPRVQPSVDGVYHRPGHGQAKVSLVHLGHVRGYHSHLPMDAHSVMHGEPQNGTQ